MKDSFKNIFSLDVKVTCGGGNVWKKIEEKVFTSQRLSFILAGRRFCINNLSLQDTATVTTHKTMWFLKDFSTRRKICCNKDFLLKISLPLGSSFRKKWKTKTIVISKLIIFYHYEKLDFTWLFWFYFAEKCVACFPVLWRNQLFIPWMHR